MAITKCISIIFVVLLVLSYASAEYGAVSLRHQLLRLSEIGNADSWSDEETVDDGSRGRQMASMEPEEIFEVSRSNRENVNFINNDVYGAPCATVRVLKHDFGYTYGKPPTRARYIPPSPRRSGGGTCADPTTWKRVVLSWRGASKGRQFDRIAAVWFGGVEFLRTCTAEPSKKLGIFWEVRKDVTRYASVLSSPQNVLVELGNLVDKTYTGIFHINITLEFFSDRNKSHSHISSDTNQSHSHISPADLVIPISNISSPSPVVPWFELSNSSAFSPSLAFAIPPNPSKILLEVYTSFHGDDEFWYSNPPTIYASSNNLTGIPSNGPFREIQAYLDDKYLIASVCPFPVVYTGGIVNLFWRPAVAIGAFDLPTYEFDVSPFIALLTDGKPHSISFRVENAIGIWYIDGNLQIWLDHSSNLTQGKLLSYVAPSPVISSKSDFKGLDGKFYMQLSRSLSYSGLLETSNGLQSHVSSSYYYDFSNTQVYKDNGSLQMVTQTINRKGGSVTKDLLDRVLISQNTSQVFPLDLSCASFSINSNYSKYGCNLTHAFNENGMLVTTTGSSAKTLKNSQDCQGEILIKNNALVVSGIGSLFQKYYSYDSNDGCYGRTLHTKNNTILFDSSTNRCS